jgi:hypothetical protein
MNVWSYTSTSPYVFMEWCLIKDQDNFNFTEELYLLGYESSAFDESDPTFRSSTASFKIEERLARRNGTAVGREGRRP